MSTESKPVCAACNKPITPPVAIVEGAVYLCDDSVCIQKRIAKAREENRAANEMCWAEAALDEEPEEEESDVPVKPTGPHIGEKVKPGSAYDRKMIKLGVPQHVRAEITTDEARRMTPEIARSMTKAQPSKSFKKNLAATRHILSSTDKDPGIRRRRGRRPNIKKEVAATIARREAGIYDPVLDEQDKKLHFDAHQFAGSSTPDLSAVYQDFGESISDGQGASPYGGVAGDEGTGRSFSFITTDNGWRLDTPDWVKYKLNDFFRSRLQFAEEQLEDAERQVVGLRTLIDREILYLYYREGREDADIYQELRSKIKKERGKESKSPEEYIKKRRQRLLDFALTLPGFIADLRKARRAIMTDYVYQTPDGEERASRYGVITHDLHKPVESLRVGARNRCKFLFDAEISRFEGSVDRTFSSYKDALTFVLEFGMELIQDEK